MIYLRFGNTLILASGSPRRQELLRSVGLEFRVSSADIDETPINGETPQVMVERLALAKAKVVAELNPGAWVLGADTTVVLAGEIIGKPLDATDAERMLAKLQGRAHLVYTAFSLVKGQITHTECHKSEVEIVPMSPAEIERYVKTGEPLDKAGAYAAQGIGAHLVAAIRGSYTNVVGLDLSATIRALKKFKIAE